jgi:DNA replication protein DnaC
MLTHPTEQRLIALGLAGMAKALEEQRRLPDVAALAFEERLALMVDREAIERQNKRLVSRLKFAGLRQNAVVEDLDMKAPRGLDKALFAKLAAGDCIDRHQNLIVIGPTGVGKSWIACALAHTACRNDRSVLYHRVPRLFDALALARGDGRHARLLKTIARVQLDTSKNRREQDGLSGQGIDVATWRDFSARSGNSAVLGGEVRSSLHAR